MLISGKGKYFHVFGCISKNFLENIFWCLEKKKENTNPEKHKPQPRKKSSTTTNPVRRPRRRSRSEIAIDGAISQSVDRDLGSSSLAYIRDLAFDASQDRAVDRDLTRSRSRSIARSLSSRDRDRWHDLAKRQSRSRIAVVGLELARSAQTRARSSPAIVGLTEMFLLLSRARVLSLSLSLIFRKYFEGKIEV